MGLLNKGNRRDKCIQDKETHAIFCKRTIQNRDGTEVDLAGFKAEIDGNCEPVLTDAYDNSNGELEDLQKKFLPKIKAKCNNTQSRYPDS